jgi:hypothetical protein
MEEAPENGKESSNSAHATGMREMNMEVIHHHIFWEARGALKISSSHFR